MKKILVIEDDELLGQLYSDLLSSDKEYSVDLEPDGLKAFEKIKQGGWDLIILDTLLPQMNAEEILSKLKRESPISLSQKILIYTNLEDNNLIDKLKTYGYEVVVKSSMNPDAFIKKIRESLAQGV